MSASKSFGCNCKVLLKKARSLAVNTEGRVATTILGKNCLIFLDIFSEMTLISPRFSLIFLQPILISLSGQIWGIGEL